MLTPELLSLLCCPESHQPLLVASAAQLAALNQRLALGQLCNRAGHTLHEPLEGGLLRADGRFLYPVRGGIPVLLVDEAIPVTTGD